MPARTLYSKAVGAAVDYSGAALNAASLLPLCRPAVALSGRRKSEGQRGGERDDGECGNYGTLHDHLLRKQSSHGHQHRFHVLGVPPTVAVAAGVGVAAGLDGGSSGSPPHARTVATTRVTAPRDQPWRFPVTTRRHQPGKRISPPDRYHGSRGCRNRPTRIRTVGNPTPTYANRP